jgi:hypothetical protein
MDASALMCGLRRIVSRVPTVRGWEDPKAPAYIADGDKLVVATDEAIAAVAHSAMLLAQGNERAAHMLGEELPEDDVRGPSG